MATIKKSAKKYATGGTVTTETTKPVKKTFKTNPDSGGVAPFTAKEQTERRKKLRLPTSKSEEKAYYAKMSKEGAKNGKAIKKAQDGSSFAKLAPPYDEATYADKIAGATKNKAKLGKGTAKSGAKMKMGGTIKKAQTGTVEPSAARVQSTNQKIQSNVNKIAMKNAGDSMQKSAAGAAKNGKSMKKCKYGCK